MASKDSNAQVAEQDTAREQSVDGRAAREGGVSPASPNDAILARRDKIYEDWDQLKTTIMDKWPKAFPPAEMEDNQRHDYAFVVEGLADYFHMTRGDAENKIDFWLEHEQYPIP